MQLAVDYANEPAPKLANELLFRDGQWVSSFVSSFTEYCSVELGFPLNLEDGSSFFFSFSSFDWISIRCPTGCRFHFRFRRSLLFIMIFLSFFGLVDSLISFLFWVTTARKGLRRGCGCENGGAVTTTTTTTTTTTSLFSFRRRFPSNGRPNNPHGPSSLFRC